MNCVARFTQEDLKRRKSPNISIGSTDAEKQMLSTDLDIHSLRSPELTINEFEEVKDTSPVRGSKTNLAEKKLPFLDNKVEPTTAYFFFTRNKSRCSSPNSPMKRSKKSTNLVKYRNFMDEPTLKRPLSRCMLLGKYKMKVSKQMDTEKSTPLGVASESIPKESNEVQVTIIDNKSLEDPVTTSDYDNITERLMVSIFQNPKNTPAEEVKVYIKQVIKDLYDVKFQEVHPVKALFRSLLEYWLKNTNREPVKTAMKYSRSIDRQSNKYFTKDENLSSVYISTVTRATQFHGLSELLVQYKKKPISSPRPVPKVTKVEKRPPKCPSPRRDTESFEKERKIQELERLLKSTVYMCETTRSKEKDIKITKTLIDNLGKLSQRSELNNSEAKNDTSNSSTEKIQDTINHLISETSIPPDVAKEFLSAYLDVLLNDDAKSLTNTSSKSSVRSAASKDLSCEVQTEAVVKRVSKSVTTLKTADGKRAKSSEPIKPVDPGQLYLKDILDKITTIFSRVKKIDEKNWSNEKSNDDSKAGDFKLEEQKDELGRPVKEYPGKNLIYENFDENSVVIDLSKYDLENISMFSDPALKGMMSISIKLKEKPQNIGESKRTHLSLKFADSNHIGSKVTKDNNWLHYMRPADTKSNEIFLKKEGKSSSPFIEFPQEFDLKPYLSSSDATSKAYKVTHESEHSLDLSFKSSNSFRRDSDTRQSYENDDTQSCYIMSFKKELATKFQSKKKVRLKECNGILLSARDVSPHRRPELTVFEKPAPRVIDEKFILLLLENLSLLSKNIPSLHKDINNLYMRLRKKHDKVVKTCGNIQGLSLLGKIYNEESCGTSSRDAATQWDIITCFENDKEINIAEIAINTSRTKLYKGNLIDANISAIDLKLILDSEAQTMPNSVEHIETLKCEPQSLGEPSLVTNMAQTDSVHTTVLTETGTTDHSTSKPNWCCKRGTKECSISTVIKCVLDSENQNFRISPQPKDRDMIKKKKQSPKVRQDLIKEISLLSPSFKVSTQSQTDRKLIRFVREKALEKDFKVYQLYLCNKYELASSLSNSNVELKPSDEMKTLYRCSSDPSYCSG